MKRIALVLGTVFVLLLSSFPVWAQVTNPTGDDPVYGVVDFGRDADLGGGSPNPTPIRDPIIISTGRFEFVGISNKPLTGDSGVLNFTLACQETYPSSRICSVTEVNETVSVPLFSGAKEAWILPDLSAPPALRSNCVGWMSRSSGDNGLALHVGPASKCSGGLVNYSCDSQLAVACCSKR